MQKQHLNFAKEIHGRSLNALIGHRTIDLLIKYPRCCCARPEDTQSYQSPNLPQFVLREVFYFVLHPLVQLT